MTRKRVLQVAYGSLANGGIQAVIMGIVRNLAEDIDFDILVFSSKKEYYDDEFLKYGRIFRTPIREKKNKFLNECEHYYRWIKIWDDCYRILKNGNYDAIHCHNEIESGICTLAAHLLGVKIRISHAHNTASPQKDGYVKMIYKFINKKLIDMNSNVKIGCSKKANEYMFGKKDKKAVVINNAIDLVKFDRTKYMLICRDKTVLHFVHVGRYCFQKNQMFLLEVFNLIREELKNSRLTLVGFGEDEDMIKSKIQELRLEGYIKMLPHDTDIPKLFANADYMIFPSRFEGLGIVLLEAQAMGVKCFASSVVPPEADMGLCTYLPLYDGAQAWAENIIDYIKDHKDESREIRQEVKEQYDIRKIAQKYKAIYCNDMNVK